MAPQMKATITVDDAENNLVSPGITTKTPVMDPSEMKDYIENLINEAHMNEEYDKEIELVKQLLNINILGLEDRKKWVLYVSQLLKFQDENSEDKI